jgi:hypothetical protein
MKACKALIATSILFLIAIPSVLASDVTRSFSTSSIDPNGTLTVDLAVDVTGTEEYYAIDEEVPPLWTIHSYWNDQNYCDANNCGDKDNDCGVTCVNLTCDTTAQVWCDSGTWTSNNYCTQCGEYDYDCLMPCENRTCDTVNKRWCDGTSWQSSGYCTECGSRDSDCCVLIDSICHKTCASDTCDTTQNRWCLTDTQGGDTSEAGHLKYIVYTVAADITYSYLIRAPDQLGPYTWTGIYMFEGMSTEGNTLGDTDVTVEESCVPSTEICDGADNDCNTQIDEGCDDDNDDYCDSGMTRAVPYSCSGGNWCCPDGGGDCVDTDGSINPGETELCDGINNDCDGGTDEDFPDLGLTCWSGIGECNSTGAYVCSVGGLSTECNAVPGSPQTETCPSNGLDDDCDGDISEYDGDSDCTGCVDIFDLTAIGGHFGETPSDPGWDPTADLIQNNEIDIFDLVMVGANFGNEYDVGACG